MNKIANEICAICGINKATTSDHLPPKSIFPKPRPNNLITVPSCTSCNNNASDLDEAFRLYLALHVGNQGDKITSKYFKEALKTYRHNKRLQREILGNAKPINSTTPNGQSIKILWNSKAHDAVIERMVRGLYFNHFGEVLHPDAKIRPKWFYQPDQKFLQAFYGFEKNIIGNNQLIYLYGRANEQPSASVWYFEFYGRHWAGASTGMNMPPPPVNQSAAESGTNFEG